MRALFLVENCLRINMSSNLCHLAYIQGAVENGLDVDVISVTEQKNAIDESIRLPQSVHWIFVDPPKYTESFNPTTDAASGGASHTGWQAWVKAKAKKLIGAAYEPYGRTPSLWVKTASAFRNDKKYDYVISLSTPFISHKLGIRLIQTGNVKCGQFLEIWEDPWTLDLFNTRNKAKTLREERRLLAPADKVVYVSPLTLEYQKELFPEHKDKMTWHPLPYYYKRVDEKRDEEAHLTFGYYGDYFSFVRNLKPFYEAAKEMGIRVNIFGNADKNFASTSEITVKPRVKLGELTEAERRTSVYIFLCNLRGGQIPGKIYQYSATNKPILFILDGTLEEQKVLKEYFQRFRRYDFCYNTVDSIKEAVGRMLRGDSDAVCEPIEAFSPKKIVADILQ